MADIFISYAKEDRLKAESLAKALETQGWSVWWDRNIPPGRTFSQEIEEAISAAKCVIVLWSEKSVNSDWVQNEAAEGARRKIMIPVLLNKVQIPFEFRRIQAANLIDWDAGTTHTELNILNDAIAQIVQPTALKKETGQIVQISGQNTEPSLEYTSNAKKLTETDLPEPGRLTSVKQLIGSKRSIIVITLLAVASTAAGIWFLRYFDVFGTKDPIKWSPLVLQRGLSSKPSSTNWALIIGIEDYDRLPKVEYARKDALIVSDYFNRLLGVPEEKTIILIDTDATKARIEGYLKNYLPRNVGKDTTLYVYFAGHGMPSIKSGEPYLVPCDADARFIEQTGYKLISFYQDINRLELEHVYVFLDASFSRVASRGSEMPIQGARPALAHTEEVNLSVGSIISLNATSGGEVSMAFSEKGHGLFTYYLLLGLRGEADANADTWTSLKELYEYVRSHVVRESRRNQAIQMPSINPPLDQWEDVKLSQRIEQ